MFYKNISSRTIYVQTPRGRVVEIPPSGIICGKWYKFKQANLVAIPPEEVNWKNVVWYPKDPLEDIELPNQLFERIMVLRNKGQLELTDYKAIVEKSLSTKKDDRKQKSAKEKTDIDLSSLSYNELLQLAKDKGLKLPVSRPKKQELIDLLTSC